MAKKKTKRPAEENDEPEAETANGDDRREYIATQALAGLFAHSTYAVTGRAAARALAEADALIKLLDAD